MNLDIFKEALAAQHQLPGVDLTTRGIYCIIVGFAQWLFAVALALTLIFLILAGVKFLRGGGDPKAILEARQNFLWVFVGAVVIIGSIVIMSIAASVIGVELPNPFPGTCPVR